MEINTKRIIDDWVRKDFEKSGLDILDFPIVPLNNEEQLKKILG